MFITFGVEHSGEEHDILQISGESLNIPLSGVGPEPTKLVLFGATQTALFPM